MIARVLTVGASPYRACGVRDYDRVLRRALEGEGVATRAAWWQRGAGTPRKAWLDEVASATRDWRPDWVVLHVSGFMYAERGLPVHVPAVTGRLRGRRVAALLHDLGHPLGRAGMRGAVWAAAQHLALADTLRRSRGVVVTSERRLAALERRRLPRRPAVVIPVFSNFTPPPRPGGDGNGRLRVGVFGFGGDAYDPVPVVDAVRLLQSAAPVEVVLLGAPGADSPQGRAWSAAAERAGCRSSLAFTGYLPDDRLAAALDSVDVIVSPDRAGASAGRSTFAAALAFGKPIVAFDGPELWREATRAGAVAAAAPEAGALATELDRLRAPAVRAARGEQARSFYRERLRPDLAARQLLTFLEGLQ